MIEIQYRYQNWGDDIWRKLGIYSDLTSAKKSLNEMFDLDCDMKWLDSYGRKVCFKFVDSQKIESPWRIGLNDRNPIPI